MLPVLTRISNPIAFASYFLFRRLSIILPIYQLRRFSILFPIYLLVIFAQLGPTFHAPALVIRALVSAANCSTMAWFCIKTSLFYAEGVDRPWGKLLTAAMQEIMVNKSSACAGYFSSTPMPILALFQPDDVDITIDASSSGGSNNFDGVHEQPNTQLLPTSHKPPTKKQKISKKKVPKP